MKMNFRERLEPRYRAILENYLTKSTEVALYQGHRFSRQAIEQQISPEEIINVHRTALKDLLPDLPNEVLASFDFLLEVMMDYGLAYQEHQSLRDKQFEIKSEIEVAVSLQDTLLETQIPQTEAVDIGAISVPAKQMNGDYYRFVQDKQLISIAIADVIGKGIPAALCMSMIKYTMDSFPELRERPHQVLENLNRVVESNVETSMFITMLYGVYDQKQHTFTYSSAGHEPGFYYDFSKNELSEFHANGLVLGVDPTTSYRQYEKKVEPRDMIVLVSDGVTESRTEEGFIERSVITDMILGYKDLPAQEMVERIYRELEKMQKYEIRDDFTLIILKRKP
jgi:phosphoserine phosphatase RsbU/P